MVDQPDTARPEETVPPRRDYPDHIRTLSLLWRTEEVPSARSGLTVGRVVDAGIEVADAEGLAGLSMRRLAAHLGVGAMTLYSYVPGKDELTWLMLDAVHAELPTQGGEGGWRARLATIAREHWDLYQRHPWLLDVPVQRPATGPRVLERWEHELRAVDGIGLDEVEMDATLELVSQHVGATAARARAIAVDAEQSGVSDDEWWVAVLPTLNQVMVGDFPLASRVGEAIGAPHLDSEQLLTYGLDRILDGVAALLATRGR